MFDPGESKAARIFRWLVGGAVLLGLIDYGFMTKPDDLWIAVAWVVGAIVACDSFFQPLKNDIRNLASKIDDLRQQRHKGRG